MSCGSHEFHEIREYRETPLGESRELHASPSREVTREEFALSSGLQGSSVFNLSASRDYFMLLRFASRLDLERWQTVPEVLRLLARADSMSVAPTNTR